MTGDVGHDAAMVNGLLIRITLVLQPRVGFPQLLDACLIRNGAQLLARNLGGQEHVVVGLDAVLRLAGGRAVFRHVQVVRLEVVSFKEVPKVEFE